MTQGLKLYWHQLQKQSFAASKKKSKAWEQDCSVHAGLMKAEYLQNRKKCDSSIFVKRCLLLSNVCGSGNIVFRSKATGTAREEQEGESISVFYPHGMK